MRLRLARTRTDSALGFIYTFLPNITDTQGRFKARPPQHPAAAAVAVVLPAGCRLSPVVNRAENCACNCSLQQQRLGLWLPCIATPPPTNPVSPQLTHSVPSVCASLPASCLSTWHSVGIHTQAGAGRNAAGDVTRPAHQLPCCFRSVMNKGKPLEQSRGGGAVMGRHSHPCQQTAVQVLKVRPAFAFSAQWWCCLIMGKSFA